jgi:hypothetical protein
MPKALSAALQLGLKPVALYGLYRLGLKLGIPQRVVNRARRPLHDWQAVIERLQILLPLPDREALRLANGDQGLQRLHAACAEILAGRVQLFGAETVELCLAPGGMLEAWESYESGKAPSGGDQDIKFTWEPGRFGWAFTLGRGYYLSGDERCSRAFWEYTEKFIAANPPYRGPHWSSAQEVALRLVALVWSLRVFLASPASTPERQERLLQAIADHAARIPATLLYARSQNNNHLLSEAAGMYTAGSLLEGSHPSAARWRKLGWDWFQRGIQQQVAADGAYSQHSANYQRLALQVALWMNLLQGSGQALPRSAETFDPLTLERLNQATRWLLGLLDAESGRLPNLGPNDGAYIFPLTGQAFDDYRPALQAAACAFCQAALFEQEDEMSLWFGCKAQASATGLDQGASSDGPLRLSTTHSWAYLRAVRFTSRPGHADQLHLDLWWRGFNLAQDAGTYRYTAPAPWDNALTHAAVHNTVTVDGLDQMRRAGRFLYLDWAQAQGALEGASAASAWHTGYRKLNIRHSRRVSAQPGDCWVVEDCLAALRPSVAAVVSHTFRLHWLLPDWPWRFAGQVLALESPLGVVEMKVEVDMGASLFQPVFMLVRAGKCILQEQRLHGMSDPPHLPILGWVSPTYSNLQPALSLVVTVQAVPPVRIITTWLTPTPETQPQTGSLH